MDLIYIEDNVLDQKICESIIHMFEADNRKRPGVTFKGLTPDIKDSSDLIISRMGGEWNSVCEDLDMNLRRQITKYKKFVSNVMPNTEPFDDIWHTSYQVQKSGHYVWHHDSAVENGKVRLLTFIWYLNTIEDGGETDFHFKSVKPVQGRFIMFPATWDYTHCGRKTTNKYIVTGWLSKDIPVKKMMY